MGKSATSGLIRKPKTRKGKRFLEHRASKVVENPKGAVFVRGGHTSEVVNAALKDWAQLKKPYGKFLNRHNPFFPFEDDTPLEKFCRKYDSSLFLFGQHSKKRPNNLILGRMFDFHVLDMIELGVTNFRPIKDFQTLKPIAAAKPCITFSGEEFETDPVFSRLQSLLTDFFTGEKVENVRLQGLELLLNFTLLKGVVHMRFAIFVFTGEKVENVRLQGLELLLNFTLLKGVVHMRFAIFVFTGEKVENVRLQGFELLLNFTLLTMPHDA